MSEHPRCDYDCPICREHHDWDRFEEALNALVVLALPLWHFGDGQGGTVIRQFEEALSRAAAEQGLQLPKFKPYLRPTVEVLAARDGWVCAYCRNPLQATLPLPEVDHVIPKSKGGTDELSNLVLACAPCNGSKGDKLLEDWKR